MRGVILTMTITVVLTAAWTNDARADGCIITVGGSVRTSASEPYSRGVGGMEGELCDGASDDYVQNDNPFFFTGQAGDPGDSRTFDQLKGAMQGCPNAGHISCFSQGCAVVNWNNYPGVDTTGTPKMFINPAINSSTPITDGSKIVLYANVNDVVWRGPGLHSIADYRSAGARVIEYESPIQEWGASHDFADGMYYAYRGPEAGSNPPSGCTPPCDPQLPNCSPDRPCGLCTPTGPRPVSELSGDLLVPVDPNEKVGPTGVGPANEVPGSEAMPYKVAFENLPPANATVQEVIVTDFLSPNLDWSTINFADINYGGRKIVIPNGVTSFNTIDIPPNDGCVIFGTGPLGVSISLQLNAQTGLIALNMKVIDTTTGTFPADPTAGILPPGSACTGGHLEYAVNPICSDPVGTVITNQASIVFDSNPPILTNQVSNTIGVSCSGL